MPPAIEQSVVFPDPDGPTSATISSAPSRGGVVEATTSSSPLGYTLRTERELQRRCRVRTHVALPMAEAGSMRSTRRRENALPTIAATSSASVEMLTIRLAEQLVAACVPGGSDEVEHEGHAAADDGRDQCDQRRPG